MKRNSLLFLILLSLPLYFGSTPQPDSIPFSLSVNSVFQPGTNAGLIFIYTSNAAKIEFKFRLLKIEDVKSFYKGMLNNDSYFDVLGKEFLLKYTRKIKEWSDRGINSVSLGKIDEPGTYILQASNGNMVAYCAVVVSKHAVIYKIKNNQALAFVQDVNTGKILPNTKFTYLESGKEFESKSDKDGIALIETDKTNPLYGNRSMLIADIGDEVLVNNPYVYNYGGDEAVGYIYTNQPVYRPGQTIYFKGIIREKNGNGFDNQAGLNCSVVIKSSKNKEVFNKDLTTNETGTLSGDFVLDSEADLGNYTIYIKSGSRQFYGSFSVEEYKKPEYEVKVELPKSNYSNGDVIEGKVNAKYYFGSPVTKGSVKVNIYKQQFWRPWWYYSDYSWFYRGFQKSSIRGFGQMEFLNSITGEVNSNGEFKFSYEVKEDAQWDYTYIISAEVTDESRRTVEGSSSAFITRGSFSLSASTDKYFTELGNPVLFRINAVDFNDKPVVTDFKIVVNYQPNTYYNNRKYVLYSDSLTGKTNESGQAQVPFLPKVQQSGYYSYIVSAKDEKGRLITTQGSFYYGKNEYYQYNYGEGIQIITDKDTYKKGDSLTAFIFLPDSVTDAVVTYENTKIFSYKKYSPVDNRIVLKEKLDERFSPSFNINVFYVKNGRFNNNSKMVGVLDEEKFLSIQIQPDKKEYKPGDNAAYQILVKDKKGNPVKGADLSIGLVDEAVYAIKEEQVQDINSFFYSPGYQYSAVFSSFNNYSYGNSRKITAIDKYGFVGNRKGNGNLSGRLVTPDSSATGIAQIILLNEEDFYSTYSDSSGRYLFKNIQTGDYEIYVYGRQGLIYHSDKPISISKNSKYDIPLPLLERIAEENGNGRGQVFFEAPMVDMVKTESKALDNNLQSGGVLMRKSETPVLYKQAEMRSKFTDAAFWSASIHTNEKGFATVNFKMPDNLTTWRATVRGITEKTLVGQEINKTITRKDLLVRMETPRFFREGDQLTVSTIIHNYLDKKKRTKITFKSDNLKITGSQINTSGYSTNQFSQNDNMYEVAIDKNTELRIDWTLLVDAPYTSAKLSVEALTDEESDAMELTVPVLPKGIKKTIPLSADLNEDKEQQITFNIPDDIDLRSAKLSFNVTPSLSGTMLKALDELAGYPYGCVEQTMSRFLPTLIAADAFKQINAPLSSNTIKELPKMIDAGVKRLYGFQHDDGGWGWWENDESNEHMTAYVVYGLALSKKAGYNVSDEVLSKGIQKTAESIKSGNGDETSTAYLVFALSTAAPDKYKDLISKKITELSDKKINPYSVSLLLLSAVNLNDKNIVHNLTTKLRSMAFDNGPFTTWKGKEWHYSWQDDEVQTTAFAVKALLNAGYKDVDKSIKWLLLQRKGFSWRSTQETASIIYALTDYLKTTNELNPSYDIKVFVNGDLQLNKKVTPQDIYLEPKVLEVIKNLHKGNNTIRIVKEGTGKVYFSGMNEYFSQDLDASGSKGMFRVEREYYLLKPVQKEGRIVYEKQSVNKPILSGEDILVKTKVKSTTSNLEYFMLEDMYPSGFEAVKDENKYEIEGENNYHQPMYKFHNPWRWFYADKEYRDEKVTFFVTRSSDEMEFSYILKAQIPGNYKSMPAQASLMYYPEYNGNSNTGQFIVKDK